MRNQVDQRHAVVGEIRIHYECDDQLKRANGRPCGHKGYVRMFDTDLCQPHANAEWRKWREAVAPRA